MINAPIKNVVKAIVFALLFACDTQEESNNGASQKISVAAATEWFNANYFIFGFSDVVKPKWELATIANNSIEVPFTVNGLSPLPRLASAPLKNSGRQRLLIEKNGPSFDLKIISYIPSAEFKGKVPTINFSNWAALSFDGTITIGSVQVNELIIWHIADGQLVSVWSGEKMNENSNARTQTCTQYEQCTDWYNCSTGECQYHDTLCDYYWVCDDSGGGGSGGGDDGNSDGGFGGGGWNGGDGGSSPIDFIPEQVDTPGDRPIYEYVDKCQGLQEMWNIYSTNEVSGYVTADGKLLVTNILGESGGETFGTYYYEGVTYYPYPKTQGAPTQEYAGMEESAGYYLIPVTASFHTHTPCLKDGTNGVSHEVGNKDREAADKSQHINHWAIGCDAIAQFDATNENFYNVQSGPLSITCVNVQ